MNKNASQKQSNEENSLFLGRITASSLAPLWTLNPPHGVPTHIWFEIGRRAQNFRPNRVPKDFAVIWRDFTLASLFSSQPRNVSRVGNRLGSTYLYLYHSGAEIQESLMDVWSPHRMSLFIKSLTGEKYTPQTRDHVARDLRAMSAGYLGLPKKLCRPKRTVTFQHTLDLQLYKLNESSAHKYITVRVVLDWLNNPDPSIKIPQAAVQSLIQEFKNSGLKFESRDFHSLRFEKLSTLDVSGFLILETMPIPLGFSFDLTRQEFNFSNRQTRFLPDTVLVAEYPASRRTQG
jgi:hypothetical protein